MDKKKEVLLINLPPGKNYLYKYAGSIYPATGVMVIGSLLRKKGFPVTLIDGAVDPEYEKKVLEKITEDTLFIGFSAMTSQIGMAVKLAKKIKEKNPDTHIVFGGVHPTLFPEQTAQNPYIDIAVINEGTKTVLEIIDYINGKLVLNKVKGIVFRDKEGVVTITEPQVPDDISEIPHFDFELLNISSYLNADSVFARELGGNGKKELRVMPILTGLGCCFKCAFCINVILKRHYRSRPAKSIVDEMKRLQSVYGANAFLFLDEDFCINKKRLSEFVAILKEEDINFLGRIWSRVSYFKNESFRKLIPEMEKIGIRSFAMGAESGSQRILDYICKNIKCEDTVCAVKELSKTGITARLSFIVGLKGEKKEETAATYKMCAELLKINPRTDIAGPFIYRYYPGSPIFQEMVSEYKIKLPDTIELWEGVLNDDGSLKVDIQQWTWPGFLKYHKSMNYYISLYTHFMSRPFYRRNIVFRMLRALLLFRVMTGQYGFQIDYLLIPVIEGVRKSLSFVLRLVRSFVKDTVK